MEIEPSTAPKAVVVSLASLAGGASLGPEAGLGLMAGGLGTWISERQKLSQEMRATNTLTGMPVRTAVCCWRRSWCSSSRVRRALGSRKRWSEVCWPRRSRSRCTSRSRGRHSSHLLGAEFTYEDWQLLAAVPLGLAAGALALSTMAAVAVFTRLAARLDRTILRSAIGGVAFGLVGVALPLTLFTGTDQLTIVIDKGADLGAGLRIAVVFAKILVFALCEATGFIGGPFLVMLFIGGTAGITAHVLIPGLPEALAFTAMFAASPGSQVAAPSSLLLLAVIHHPDRRPPDGRGSARR
jgi:H+/Cl- antiporter ClcA